MGTECRKQGFPYGTERERIPEMVREDCRKIVVPGDRRQTQSQSGRDEFKKMKFIHIKCGSVSPETH